MRTAVITFARRHYRVLLTITYSHGYGRSPRCGAPRMYVAQFLDAEISACVEKARPFAVNSKLRGKSDVIANPSWRSRPQRSQNAMQLVALPSPYTPRWWRDRGQELRFLNAPLVILRVRMSDRSASTFSPQRNRLYASSFVRSASLHVQALSQWSNGANQSVKPTRSGLRPPRAAYLKR